jgi:hypothetical protein
LTDVSFTSVVDYKLPSTSEETTHIANELKTKLLLLQSEEERLYRDNKLLEAFASKMNDPAFAVTPREFVEFAEVYQTRGRELNVQMLELRQEIVNVTTELGKLGIREKAQLGVKEEHVQVTADLELKEDGKAAMVVSYIVPNASWKPRYDVRASRHSNELSIVYYADITQHTGEDWVDANVQLSTMTPNLSSELPQKKGKWMVTTRARPTQQPRNVVTTTAVASTTTSLFGGGGFGSTGGFGQQTAGGGLFGGFAAQQQQPQVARLSFGAPQQPAVSDEQPEEPPAEPEEPEEPEEAPSGLAVSPDSMTFQVTDPVTIASNAVSSSRVKIATITLDALKQHVLFPRRSLDTYIKANIVNSSVYTLLPGPANVFVDNSYITCTQLQKVVPKESFELSLGIDPLVKVDAPPAEKKEFTTNVGFYSKHDVKRIQLAYKVGNHGTTAIKVNVFDQIPTPQVGLVHVKVVKRQVNNKDLDISERALESRWMEWNLDVAANETVSCSYAFEIAVPQGETVVGIKL